MFTYSTCSEAGGVGKMTTAANLAVAHVRTGSRPFAVLLDPQGGDLPHLFGADDQWTDSVNNIARHMIRRPNGDFGNLIWAVEGVDIVPEHNMPSGLVDFLRREKNQAGAMGRALGMHAQLLRVLHEAGIPKEYDVLICGPSVTEGPYLRNVIYAMWSLVISVEPNAKGRAVVEGSEVLVAGFENQFKIGTGMLTVVSTEFKNTYDRRQVLAEIDHPIPEIISEYASLMEGC